MRLLVDTDVFCKLGIAGLLERSLGVLGVGLKDCGRLPALPHMLRRGRLPKLYGQPACDALLPTAEAMALAPTPGTVWLDRLAAVTSIDPGEALLFAAAAEQSLTIVTGDKRALRALAGVPGFPEAVAKRIVTLEVVLLALCRQLGDEPVRGAVAPLRSSDRTVQICFSPGNTKPRAALLSYFTDLKREVEPLVLWEPPTRGDG